ncbi:MAG: LysM peptidoglycan-binding domain-containing protein [Thermoleophilia bacterium]
MSRAIGRVAAPIAALGLVVLLVSLLASSDLLPRSPRPAGAGRATTTATTIIEFQLPAPGEEPASSSAVTGDAQVQGGLAGDGATGDSNDGTDGSGGEGGSTDASDATAAGGGTDTTGVDAAGGQGGAEQTYRVEAGDTPYDIAQRFGVSTQRLMEANEITDPTELRVGAVLRIPSE